jgi:hypothetical protein
MSICGAAAATDGAASAVVARKVMAGFIIRKILQFAVPMG